MDITFSIFPKFYRHLRVEELAELIRTVGLDTTNLAIREGYWVSGRDLAAEVPAFVKAMAAAGLSIHFATAGFSPEQVIADDTPLRILADNGVGEYRMSYFRVGGDGPRASLDAARRQMEQVAEVCARCGVRAVYQVHHGTLVPTATGAYYLVRGLPAEHVGVMLDPGNQAFEGFEKWDRSARLLGGQLAAIGVKDVAVTRDPDKAGEPGKGWKRDWTTVDRGVTNWHELVAALKGIDFKGTFVWMPFYDADDPEEMTRKLGAEVAYLRKVVADVEAEG
jgi:sugar phosphate isomerase/epimerase